MNILLLDANEVDATGIATIRDSTRLAALLRLGLSDGSQIKVGIIDGRIGKGRVQQITAHAVQIRVTLSEDPPPAAPLELVIALPRPKMLRRILRICGEYGIKKIWLLNSYRVEKSYWQSPLLSAQQMRPYLLEGLQQVGDSVLPELVLERRFRPFVEDRLGTIGCGRQCLLAHPDASRTCPHAITQPCSLVVGPEGGFTQFEVTLIQQAGFQPVSLGSRVLRVETALPVLLGRLGQ